MVELFNDPCAGLDVHKKSVSACIRICNGNQTRKETATFRTFTADLDLASIWRKVTSFLATVGKCLSGQSFLQLLPG